ncbi:MAG: squalene--hopene cyclase, partial [Frankia sp.]|nr:squalene--hopene cyclase [Frankia sp.]
MAEETELARTLRRAVAHLRSLQDETGWWKGDLESNTTIDSEDILLRHWLGVPNPERAAMSAKYIRSWQRPDGSWPYYYGGPGEISTTVESYIALRLCGDEPTEPHMQAAAAWVRAHGGVPKTRVFTRIWLAMFGWWSWDDLPVLPPEIMFLPKRAPLSIYRFASWARQTIVALTVLMTYRPVSESPFPIDELFPDGTEATAQPERPGTASADAPRRRGLAGLAERRAARRAAAEEARRTDVAGRAKNGNGPGRPLPNGRVARLGAQLARRARAELLDQVDWKRVFETIDAGLHLYHRHQIRPLRTVALALAERWMIVRQEADGCFGGIQPPTVFAIIALRLLGYPMDHPVLTAALRSLDLYAVRRPDGSLLQEACQSPVWDTCLSVIALSDAGVPADDPGLQKAADWLLGQEVSERRGDWSVPIPHVPTGGWAFEFENDTYPDTDDTAEVMLALNRVGRAHRHPERVTGALHRGVQWLFGMQSADGGWGAFDVNNEGELVYKIPFADFGLLTDPPSADVTAHVVEVLCELGLADDPRTQRGVAWLLHSQEADGSWYGRWGVNHIYGTGGVLPALRAAGLPADHPAIQRAADWLVSRQNPDGGWGEDCYSYEDMSTAGVGRSTASQTAWALLGLIAAGRVGDGEIGAAAARGAAWLAATQT